jgi:hypothetical protein
MSTLKPALIALSLVLVAPMAVQASEITLVPAVKLQIGDRDNNGLLGRRPLARPRLVEGAL